MGDSEFFSTKRLWVGLAIGIPLLLGLLLVAQFGKSSSINSYDDCVKAGGAVMESFPPQCQVNGRFFVDGD